MKILLQNTESLSYVRRESKGPPRWTDDPAKAMSFTHALAALFFCYGTGLEDMRLCIEFPDARRNFSIAVAGAQSS